MMRQPNFIVFLTDDQGYGDLSCMGADDFVTPHLDRMADEGSRFTCWYSNSPVCSPSRASLLTGRYPGNAGVRSILAGHRTAAGLPLSTPTIATALKSLDYQTYLSGKWHLGLEESARPHSHGFDRWYGHMAGCIDYFSHVFYWGANRGGPGQNPTHDLWEDNQEIWQNGEYFTEMIVEKAILYIREAAKSDKPFFLYVPFNAPHYPMHAPEKYMNRFSHLPWDRKVMAAMISAVDDGVGQIMAELERQGVADNTCTFFTSDNGPSRESRNWLDGTIDPYYGGTAGKFKGHKFSLFEGGIREPGIMHWPDRVPRRQVLNTPVASMDVFPTILTAAGGEMNQYEIDGINLLSHVADGIPLEDRDLCWEQDNQTAIRRGPWKLVLNGQLLEEEAPHDEVWLSNLDEDIGEQVNLRDARPDISTPLAEEAQAWRDGIEARWDRDYAPACQGTT
ncbi:MAG: sulfatase-like hydrolase/transferase [Gemmatimonadota bacterium]|nr:sulfatase-like hydrolase/transferase [Gemmatimonadota bacterium]